MSTTTTRYHEVVVEAADGPAALALEHRLAHLRPVSVGRDGRWIVEIPAVEAPPEVEAAVRDWLAEVGERSAVWHVDGATATVEAAPHARVRPRTVRSNAGFIG